MNKFDSKLEKTFSKLLDKAGIKWINQFKIGRKRYDFYLPDSDTIIEVDGDYWHGNVITENYIDRPFKKKIFKNDALKNIMAENAGFRLIRIWETDIKTMTVSQLRELLK